MRLCHISSLTVKILPSFRIRVIVGVFCVIGVGDKMEEKDLQSPTLQISVLDKSLDSTSLQYEIQDRTLVRSPLSHVLLQDDHWPHEANSGESEQTLKNAIDAQRDTPL